MERGWPTFELTADTQATFTLTLGWATSCDLGFGGKLQTFSGADTDLKNWNIKNLMD